MKKSILLIFISIVLFISCENNSNSNDELTLEEIYELACDDAISATYSEIWDSLTIIRDDNKQLIRLDDYVLVCTFTQFPESYTIGDTIVTSWGDTWVTVVPEVKQQFFNYQFLDDSSFILRNNQLLGLPIESGCTHYAEVFVKPEDLFRPSPDNEITDSVVYLNFPANTDNDYKIWFNNNLKNSYFPDEGPRYPWTRLGYTYDWNPNTDEIGVSEFVIKPNSKVIVNDVKIAKKYIFD